MSTSGVPIKPKEVVHLKPTQIPPGVFNAFNNMIVKHYDGDNACFLDDEVVQEIRSLMNGQFKKEWLNVEICYNINNWNVYHETSGDVDCFTFSGR